MATCPVGPELPPPSAFADAHLPAARRKAIERTVEHLIAILDAADGEEDFEDDDPCGMTDEDGVNTAVFSVQRALEDEQLYRPRYDADQSRGPINQREMYAEHRRFMMGAA